MKRCEFFTPSEKKIIQKRFKVIWYEDKWRDLEKKLKTQAPHEMSIPMKSLYSRHFCKWNYTENIPILGNLHHLPLNFKSQRRVINGEEIDIKIITKNQSVYKGMKYFYGKQFDDNYRKESNNETWVAEIDMASIYAQRYNGGIHAYRCRKDLRLIDLSSQSSLGVFLKAVKDNEELSKAICLKFGEGCSLVDQIDKILKYNRWGESIWLRKYFESDTECSEKLYIYGAGKNDRIISKAMYSVFGEEIDGWYCRFFQSPFFPTPLHGEILLFDQMVLKRDIHDKYDWWQWKHTLPLEILPPSVFILNSDMSAHNNNFRLLKFYRENYNRGQLHQYIPPGAVYVTFNVHFFISINFLQTKDDCFQRLKDLIDACGVATVICLQEVDSHYLKRLRDHVKKGGIVTTRTKSRTSNTWEMWNTPNGSTNESLHIVMLVKSSARPTFKTIKSTLMTKHRNMIHCVTTINNSKTTIVGCHFPNGVRYDDKPEVFIDQYKLNIEERIRYLNMLLKQKPDVMMGDFNFTPQDPEVFQLPKIFRGNVRQIEHGVVNTSIDSIVDYILTKQPMVFTTIPLECSDHLPLVASRSVYEGESRSLPRKSYKKQSSRKSKKSVSKIKCPYFIQTNSDYK